MAVHEYVARPEVVLTEQHLRCPICPDPHCLWRHGWYRRTAIVPDGEPVVVGVARLLCRHTGTTVSLLPDFCLPRRQHGPAVLGLLLQALVVAGKTLGAAMRSARPGAPVGHSLPQSLLAGFQRQLPRTRAWLAGRRARAPDVPSCPSRWPLEIRWSVMAILGLGGDAGTAFIRAGRGVHDLAGVGLA